LQWKFRGVTIAIVFGISGAENDLINLAKEKGFHVTCIDDIGQIKNNLDDEYTKQEKQVMEQINTEITDLTKNIEVLDCEIEIKSSKIKIDINSEIEKLEKKIKEIEKIKFNLEKLFIFIKSKFEKYKKKRRYKYLVNNPKDEVQKLLKNEYFQLKNYIDKKQYLKNNFDIECKHRLSNLLNQVDKIGFIKKSKIYKGAKGEILVIEKLRNLTDDYCIFNDLFFKLDHGVNFNGTFLKSAQIDHLVIGPSGIYVIETKNWSEAYVKKVFENGSYTPYDQIKRSSYAVYRHLNSSKYGNVFQKAYYSLAKKEIKVISIIAITGSKIPLQDKGFVKVLFPNQLSGYISERENILSNEMIENLVKNLR